MLDDLAGLGPFFAVSSHPPGTPVPPWRPVDELLTSSGPLTARIAAVRTALAARAGLGVDAIEPRVAASTLQLGLAARLVSPALGAAVLRCPLDLRSGGLWWQAVDGGPVPLSVPGPAGPGNRERAPGRGNPGRDRDRDPGRGPGPAAGDWDHAGDWDQVLFEGVLVPVTAAIARLVPVSGRVLWGNVASAVNAAARQVARQRPDLAGDAGQAAARLFASPRLRGERNPPGPAFLRSSCCLFYRLAPEDPSATCGDCVLRGRTVR